VAVEVEAGALRGAEGAGRGVGAADGVDDAVVDVAADAGVALAPLQEALLGPPAAGGAAVHAEDGAERAEAGGVAAGDEEEALGHRARAGGAPPARGGRGGAGEAARMVQWLRVRDQGSVNECVWESVGRGKHGAKVVLCSARDWTNFNGFQDESHAQSLMPPIYENMSTPPCYI
jgi:hypothetical protein